MCGITALLALKKPPRQASSAKSARHVLATQIDSSLEIVKHRGPDARGQWISPDCRVGIGHVRLSIIDLSPEGNQPFHDSDNQIYAVVNGELYEHDRLRSELEREYEFQGHSDCELVIALYKHYGLSCLSHMRGEFGFVLWDSKRELLFAGRDRYGIKSLYYTFVDGQLLIATEVKSFLAFGWQPEWNVQAIRDCGWRLDARTMFKGVRKILPGNYLMSKHFDRVEQFPYWDLEYPDKNVLETRTEEEMILGVREQLLEAVRLRLRADVPVGIYLSGGLDSSAVAGMAAHLIKEQGTQLGNDASHDSARMQCFTVQFDKDSGADESDIAQRTAEWLGVRFHPVVVNEEVIAAGLEDTTWYTETVGADTNGPGRLAMAKAVHEEGLKVVLTGEGSDEHFGGYSFFHTDALREPDPSWPPSSFNFPDSERLRICRDAEASAGDTTWAAGTAPVHPPSTSRMLNNTHLVRRISTITPLHFTRWAETTYPDTDLETVVAELPDGRTRDLIANKWHPLHTSEYLWTKTAFANNLLRHIGDNVDMPHHIESRTPFLDHHLTAYANSIPPSLKMRYDQHHGDWREKYILREAVRPFVTDEMYTRRKHPFLGPVRFPEDGPLRKVVAGCLTKENIEGLGFVDWEAVKGLCERAFRNKEMFAFREALTVAQFVTIGKRFGVKQARLESADVDGNQKGCARENGYVAA